MTWCSRASSPSRDHVPTGRWATTGSPLPLAVRAPRSRNEARGPGADQPANPAQHVFVGQNNGIVHTVTGNSTLHMGDVINYSGPPR